jgi:chitin disaccharide deacetylase
VDSTPSTRLPRRLIVNADDFGMSPAVSSGIIEAAEAGSVSSASMIVNLDGFDDAVRRAKSFGALPLGLHFNIVAGRPLTRAPSLTDKSGSFVRLGSLLWRATTGRINACELAAECVAQLDRMSAVGLRATHLDSHRHVHMHPAIFSTIVAAGASRGVGIVRVPIEPLRTNFGNLRATAKKIGLSISTKLHSTNGVERPDHFFGISMQGGESFGPRLLALIPRLPAGTSELMTHPGHVDAALENSDSYTWQREMELSTLLSPRFRELLQRNDVQLASFESLRSGLDASGEVKEHRKP